MLKEYLSKIARLVEAATASDVLQVYQDWKDESTDDLVNWFMQNKVTLDRLRKEQPKIFQPPVGKQAYRGASIPANVAVEILKKKLKNSQPKIVKIVDLEGYSESFIEVPNVPYAPTRKAQSWTLNKNVAASFSLPHSKTKAQTNLSGVDRVGIIYQTTIDNDFYMNPRASGNEALYTDEKEVLRIGGSGNYTAFIRLKDLPADAALQYGGKGAVKKALEEYKSKLFKFLNQWVSVTSSKAPDIEQVIFDQQGNVSIELTNKSVVTVDQYYDAARRTRTLLKTSWRDDETKFNKEYVDKEVAKVSAKVRSLLKASK